MADENTAFRDFLLRNSHYQARFENGTIKEIAEHYATAKADIVQRMARLELYGTGFTREFRLQRLQNMLDEVNVVLDNATRDATGVLTGRLGEFASTQADMIQDRLADVAGKVNMGINRLAAHHVFAMVEEPMLGEVFGDRLLWNNAEAVRAIRNRLTQSVIMGEDMATARKELVGLGRQMGGRVGKLIVARADVIARTEIQRVSNSVNKAVYDANQDVIRGIQRVETLDRWTCIVCGAGDGRVYYYASNIANAPPLPAHPRCRGTYAPITKSWKELGIDKKELPASTRASMSGQVPARVKYNDWLKEQEKLAPGFAEDILGKTRYRMWKDGKIKLTEMVRDNKILSVKQLRGKIGEVPWKPVMTEAKANEWAKNSKIKNWVVHTTQPDAKRSIMKEGFSLEEHGFGRSFGDGVYFSRYADSFYGKSTIHARINSRNPLIDAAGVITDRQSKLYADIMKFMTKEGDFEDAVTKFMKAGNYDALITQEAGSGTIYVVPDPMNIVVTRNISIDMIRSADLVR